MSEKLIATSVAVGLAVLGIWLLAGGMASVAAAEALPARSAAAPGFSSLVTDTLPSPWPAQLEWAQEEFTYGIGSKGDECCKVTVYFTARTSDVIGLRAKLPSLQLVNDATESALMAPFATAGFLSVTVPLTTKQDNPGQVTLIFKSAEELPPPPGTYTGQLRLEADNAAPITQSLTFIFPSAHAQGIYQLAVAELGQASFLSPSLVLTTFPALQMTTIHWLPGSADVFDGWPLWAGGLLFVVTIAALAAYVSWAWFGSRLAVAIGGGAGVLGSLVIFLMIVVTHSTPGLETASTGTRTVLLWESQGRGPVRQITVAGNEVASASGATGMIEIIPKPESFKIAPSETRTLTVAVNHLAGPGVYLGRLVIQSPDLAAGAMVIPIQVAVHDLILWPALAILLGVIVGSYARYEREINSQRMEKRRQLEQAWQAWDDYLLIDPFSYQRPQDGVGSVNPIYGRINLVKERVKTQLDTAPEWGIEDATLAIGNVAEQLTRYKRLSTVLVAWKADADRMKDDNAKQWLETLESALRSGQLEQAATIEARLLGAALPGAITTLRKAAEVKFSDPAARQPITSLLDTADKLCTQGLFDEALLKVLAAEQELGSSLVTSTPVSSFPVFSPPVPSMRTLSSQGRFEIQKVGKGKVYVDDVASFEVVLVTDGNREKVGTVESLDPDPKSSIQVPQYQSSPLVQEVRLVNSGKIKLKATISQPEAFLISDDATSVAALVGMLEQLVSSPQGDVPQEVRDAFEGKKYPLRKPPQVKVLTSGRWQIESDEQTYLIVNEGQSLRFSLHKFEGELQVETCAYAVHKIFPIHDRVGDTILFNVVRHDADGTTLPLPKGALYHWSFDPPPGSKATVQSSQSNDPFCLAEFPTAGEWKVKAEVKFPVEPQPDQQPGLQLSKQGCKELPLAIKDSAMAKIYKDKRRHNFYQSMIALVIALVTGMLAQRVFSLTFGTLEEYLLAFAWGAGIDAGVGTIANLPAWFRNYWDRNQSNPPVVKTGVGSVV